MTPAEIIRAHAAKQGLSPNVLAARIQKFLDQPKATVVTQGDCLFLLRDVDKTAFFYILNGGNAGGYLRALQAGVNMLRKLGYEKAAMRVADKEKSKKIAASVGINQVSYKKLDSDRDPYLMTMEL